jgi:hypothetical protein
VAQRLRRRCVGMGSSFGLWFQAAPCGRGCALPSLGQIARFKPGTTHSPYRDSNRSGHRCHFLISVGNICSSIRRLVRSSASRSSDIHNHTRGHVTCLRASGTSTRFTKGQLEQRCSLPGRVAFERVRCRDPSKLSDFPHTRVVDSRRSRSVPHHEFRSERSRLGTRRADKGLRASALPFPASPCDESIADSNMPFHQPKPFASSE